MKVQPIECKKIAPPKREKNRRSIDMEFAVRLAESIKTHRMLHAIRVRKDRVEDGHYIILAGRQRWYAKAKILKEPVIECIVLDVTDDEAEAIRIAENLSRSPKKKSQHGAPYKRWYDLFAKRHPDRQLVGQTLAFRGRRGVEIQTSGSGGNPCGSNWRPQAHCGARDPHRQGVHVRSDRSVRQEAGSARCSRGDREEG